MSTLKRCSGAGSKVGWGWGSRWVLSDEACTKLADPLSEAAPASGPAEQKGMRSPGALPKDSSTQESSPGHQHCQWVDPDGTEGPSLCHADCPVPG